MALIPVSDKRQLFMSNSQTHHEHDHPPLAHLCMAGGSVECELERRLTNGRYCVRVLSGICAGVGEPKDPTTWPHGTSLLATWDGESRSATTGRPLLLSIEPE